MEFFGIFQFITIKKTYGSDYRPIDHLVQTDSTFLTFEKIVLNFLIFVGQRLFAKKSGKKKPKTFILWSAERHTSKKGATLRLFVCMDEAIVVLST